MEKKNYSSEGEGIKVLILSDRLMDRAAELAEFLNSTERVQVVGLVGDRQQALRAAEENSFDYLIIAGYLKAENGYGAIAELRKRQKRFLAVQWAMLDALVVDLCRRHQIPLSFERTRSPEEFAAFLESHRNDPALE